MGLTPAAAAADPVPVYRAYDGPALPSDRVARLFAPTDTWIRAFDGRALADIRRGVFFELPAGPHSMRLKYEAPPSSVLSRTIFQASEPLQFDFEGGRSYRVRWENRDRVFWWPSIEPHPELLPTVSPSAELCWYDVLHGGVESLVWGKSFRERLRNPPQLTLRVDGVEEPRTWAFSSAGVFAKPEGKMQELASNWNADGTFRGYLIGLKPLVPGRRVRALVSTCRPEEIREVILE
jgi:hypothetical protein